MRYRIDDIEGISRSDRTKLKIVGISDTDKLLATCGNRDGRKTISKKTGIAEATLLKWANMADLMRISGIGEEYSELLEAAGVDTAKELQKRKAEVLAEKLAQVNFAKKLTRFSPTASQVEKWIRKAKSIEKFGPLQPSPRPGTIARSKIRKIIRNLESH